ncbi:hypothetical protein [Streptomyces sp. DH12]|uniref:hypothetical protein n=1 Tax=Streptomyces sp. DH12 TaxID=2857010 RepID=UPI001E329324|nr:hypothetical protein [Streptomyces sp. DH12]
MTYDIGRELAQLKKRLEAVERQSRLGSASVDDTTLEIRDATGSLRGLIGQQADGTTAVNVVNGPTPPAPSTPSVTPALGGLAVTWDGTFTGGAPAPLDWSRVEVHAAPDTGFTPTPDTLQATIESPQGGIVYLPATEPLHVLLLSRNTSGAASSTTTTVGPYEARPLADDIGPGGITETHIADGAVTTPKVFANAITTPLLAAGSVDAVALKADAITGKIITGGVINGAEFHSDNGAGALVDIEDGKVTTTASNGWKILIDPTQARPVVDFHDGAGNIAGSINGSGDNGEPSLNISSGPFPDGAITDWRWVTALGRDATGNGWRVARVRHSDNSVQSGGHIHATPTYTQIGYIDTANPTDNVNLYIGFRHFLFHEGRASIQPPASADSALTVSAKAAHTGKLLHVRLGDADRLTVSPAGDLQAAGSIAAPALTVTGTATVGQLAADTTTWTAYTPTVAGGGTATYTARTGWYYKLGKIVFFSAEFTVGTAGSGASLVTVTTPTAIDRTTRQVFPLHAKGAWTSGMAGNGNAVSLETGSGNVIDHLSMSNDNAQNRDGVLAGVNLLSTARISITGWYREA